MPASAERVRSPVATQVPSAASVSASPPASTQRRPEPQPAVTAALRQSAEPTGSVSEPATVGSAEAPSASQAARFALAELKPAHWIDLFRQLPLSGVARNIAANSALQDVSGNRLTLVLEENKATLYNDEHRKRIEAVLADYFDTTLQLRVEIGAVAMETPAAWRLRREMERRETAHRNFVEDPLVRALVERFGAEIQYDSITSTKPDELL